MINSSENPNELTQQLQVKYNQLRIKFNLMLVSLAIFILFLGFKKPDAKTITAERINIVEPNGKLRMVLSNKTKSPGNLYYGKEFIKGGNRSGIIFYNDEETECGGLVFDGKTDSITKKAIAAGHLSFDQHNQNQVVYLSYSEEDGKKEMGLNIDEWQEAPSFKVWRDQVSEIYTKTTDPVLQKKMYENILYPSKDKRAYSKRAFLGRDESENASLILYDKLNRKKLVVSVDASGIPSIQFLNNNGEVIKVIEGN